ncbi:hypothetical protein EDC01DRAFT_257890 [Geopyxis carbonaria]|nr:hypothetical protein EDC01DRAFT_257890 [Geopyxis carbonaria]
MDSVDLTGEDKMLVDTVDPVVDEKHSEDVTIITPDDEETQPTKPLATDHEAMMKYIFPHDPTLEIASQTIHTWEIRDWQKMERRSHGPTFECGGSPWRVLFFPLGNNCDCASFYLEHGYEDKPPEDWYKCVQFGLVLWNPNDPSISTFHQAHHRFTQEEADWGFTRFIELRELMVSTEKGRPLVENEAVNLTAYVRVMKDPTGVLWHNFVNYDSKKETGYVGLKNQGATCYLNSLLQALYFTNSFRRAVYKIPTEDEDYSNSALALQRLFYLLQTSNDAVGTTELTKSFGWESQDIFAQQDIQELNRILMEKMETKMKGTEVENLLTRLFVGKTKTYIRCIDVEYASERVEDFWDIQLNVRGFKNLDDSFKDYIAEETMDGENKYFAEGHGLQDAKKGVIFESFPEVLHLHLKRFEYDLNTYAMQKVNDHYEFPEEFDAAPYLSPETDRSESWEYVLHGVLVHSGDLNAGHYYAFLKPEEGGNFFKFDDDRVTRATKRETLDDNFGGDYAPGENGVRNQYTRQISLKRSMNAYMLVYLRKTKVEEILVPVTEAETPPHLSKRLEMERAAREQKRKEREEQPLFLQVKAVSDRQFKAHQGFDLVDWSDKDGRPESAPLCIRFRKASTIRDLKIELARHFEANPEKVHLWLMVNRQNKTVRPDQPLSEMDQTVEEASSKGGGTKSQDLRVWVEVRDDVRDAARIKDPNSPWFVVFLKHYDPIRHTLKGHTHLYMRKNDKVAELIPIIQDMMEWGRSEVKLYEEIKPTMIEPMKPKQSFNLAEIQDGDIICFQKVLTEKESDQVEALKHYKDAKEFYEFLLNLTKIRFQPKVAQANLQDFVLELSRKMSYDDVAEKVGQYLNVQPTHLRFTTVNANTGAARSAIKRASATTLQQMVTNQYYTTTQISHNSLFYEILDMSLAELETKKILKFTYLPDGIAKEELCDALVPKSGSLADTIPTLQQRFGLSSEIVPRIRFFQAHLGKIHKEMPHGFSVAGMQDFTTLYAEIVPEEELAAGEDDRIIQAFHFQKEPSKVHSSGVPFTFVVKKGETFDKTRVRLQIRTGIKGKPFEKIKFALVQKSQFSKPTYLADEDVLYDMMTDSDDLLGLDHVDKNGRNGWGRNGPEIRIK